MNTTHKTPGQINFEGRFPDGNWSECLDYVKAEYETAAQAVLADQWREMSDPPTDIEGWAILRRKNQPPQVAVFEWAQVSGLTCYTGWMPIPASGKPEPGEPVAVESDPHAECRAAQAAGKRVQCIDTNGNWADPSVGYSWTFDSPPDHYRIAPKPQMVPLGMDDIEVTDEFREIGGSFDTTFYPSGKSAQGVHLYGIWVAYSSLQRLWLINRNDGLGWVACEKEATP